MNIKKFNEPSNHYREITTKPLQSPSPDRKRANVIAPTFSPDQSGINHKLKHKFYGIYQKYYKTNPKPFKYQQIETKSRMDYQSLQISKDSQELCYQQSLEQSIKKKDQIIYELRKIINKITQNQRYKKDINMNEQLQNQNKILMIENQKLLVIIEKMKKNKQNQYKTNQKIYQYQTRDKIYQDYQLELQQELKRQIIINKSLENEIIQLKRQIEILLNDTWNQFNNFQQSQKNDIQNKDRNKQEILKLKEFYQNQILEFKQRVTEQIQNMFSTIQLTLESINRKVNKSQKRIDSICNDLIEINQKNKENKRKPFRDGLQQSYSQMLRQAHYDNQIVKEELKKVKLELKECLKKHQLMIDNSDGDEDRDNTQNITNKGFENLILQKNLQIQKIQQQLEQITKQIKQQNKKELQNIEQQYQKKIKNIIELKDNQIQQIKDQNILKIKQIKQSYQRELQSLKNNVTLKSASLSEFNSLNRYKQQQLQSQIDTLNNLITHLQQQYKIQKNQLQQNLIQKQLKINQFNQKLNEYNLQISSLKSIITNYQQKLLKNQQKFINIENQKLLKIQQQSQIKLFSQNLLKKINQITLELQKSYLKIDQFNNQNQKKYIIIKQKQQKINYLQIQYQKLIGKLKRKDKQVIINQLNQIKQLINLQNIYKMPIQINNIRQSFQRTLIQLQEKNFELSNVLKENLQLRDQNLYDKERIKYLQENIHRLQENQLILKQELKENNQKLDKIFGEKSKIETQLIYLKKSLYKRFNKEYICSNQQLSMRISNLLKIERQRQKQLGQIQQEIQSLNWNI